eukprot:TRINITY_DN1736_c0_g1_i2.p2 TRINITY_DN1736_c0_g1~~TRINITY_DN1736_c0_g1_i2.p2  ORF type:complete len:83 (-),score=16.08 TRINITY_DN1736_c0_g1_i2:161-409(-)
MRPKSFAIIIQELFQIIVDIRLAEQDAAIKEQNDKQNKRFGQVEETLDIHKQEFKSIAKEISVLKDRQKEIRMYQNRRTKGL